FLQGERAPFIEPRARAELGFEPLPGSRLLRSYEVEFNGQRTPFAMFRSEQTAREVVAQFEQRHERPDGEASRPRGNMVRVVTRDYCLAGAVNSEGETVGLVAFDEPKAGGCTYFIGRGGGEGKGWRHGDVPGEEVPGIPRPLRSRRIFCVDGLGGIPSRLLVYEGWGSISDTVERFATEMPRHGWTRNADAERVLAKNVAGTLLSFVKGTQRAMVYIERDEGTNKVRTAVAYTVKAWLPPDRGI
ncbi:MAG: hypothetical protein ACODAJ_17055, partial [Planctomycetota bacterium]